MGRQTDGQTNRQREKERDRESMLLYSFVFGGGGGGIGGGGGGGGSCICVYKAELLTCTETIISAVGSGMKAREASQRSASMPLTSPDTIRSFISSTVASLPAMGRASRKNFLQTTCIVVMLDNFGRS